jgi:hypothetical protein
VVLAHPANASQPPPTLSGHAVDGRDQIVLGPATLAQLHERLGGTVTASVGTFVHARRVIVGTATMPTAGLFQGLHTSLGTGALASAQILGPLAAGCDGPPAMALIRLRSGVTAAAGHASLQRVAAAVTRTAAGLPASSSCRGVTLSVIGAQHPAQIANYRSMGAAPDLLAGGLSVGAFAGLAFTLIASVRRRRRDLAVLKTLGFTRRQLAGTVAWQASVAAVWNRDGDAARRRARPVPADPVRPADLRGARPGCVRRNAGPGGARHDPARQSGGGDAGPQRRPHGSSARAAHRMSPGGAQQTSAWW